MAGLIDREPDVRSGRALHLIDLENLSGDPRMDLGRAVATVNAYLRTAACGPDDLVRLACNARLYWRVKQDLPADWDVRPANGSDGADRALLASVDAVFVARRFDRLVVGSGDGIFTELALHVRALGPDVWSVSRPGALHHELRNSVSRPLVLGVPDVIDLTERRIPA